MHAMILEDIGTPLKWTDLPIPKPQPNQILIKISACGVCRTDLHIINNELKRPKLPLILGHQVVGKIQSLGSAVTNFQIGERVGVPWLAETCQACEFCLSGRENLCDKAVFTGYQINGGYAEYCVANALYAFSLPIHLSDLETAPLLCGGLIGYRALKLAGNVNKFGFFGFGSSAHILTQILTFKNKQVYAFVRKGDSKAVAFAKSLGVTWAGYSDENPPCKLDAVIIFAPSGNLIPHALNIVKKGGSVICAGIHMSDIPSFPYHILWQEKILRSVANLTRLDAKEFLDLTSKIPIKTKVNIYPLQKANEALNDLKLGHISGSCVLTISQNHTLS